MKKLLLVIFVLLAILIFTFAIGQFGPYNGEDVIRIERTGTVIKYYHNNVLKHTSTFPSLTLMMADVAFYSSGAIMVNVRSSFSTASKNITSTFEYDPAGRRQKTWHQLDAEPNILLAKNDYNELGNHVRNPTPR